MGGIDPRFTLGDLAQQRDQVLRRLVAGGHLDRNKRHLAEPGAVAHRSRHERGQRRLARLRERAAQQRRRIPSHGVRRPRARRSCRRRWWPAASKLLARRPLDAVVVIRGGGARNELAVFDAEEIAMAIANASVARAHRARPRGRPQHRRRGRPPRRSRHRRRAPSSSCSPRATTSAAPSGPTGQPSSGLGERLDGADQRLGDRAHRIARRTHAAVGRADEGLNVAGDRRCVVGRCANSPPPSDGWPWRSSRLAVRPRQVLAAEQRHVDALAARARTLDPVGDARTWLDDHAWGRRGDPAVVSGVWSAGDDLETQFADGRLRSTATVRTEEKP